MSNHGLTADNMMQQFPIALQKDPKTVALGQAIAKVMESRQDEIDSLRIYTRIDELPEWLLDILARDFAVDWYDRAYTLEEKRKTIKDSFYVHRHRGTKAAVERASDSLRHNDVLHGSYAGCYRTAGSQRTCLCRWCGQHNSDENDYRAARNYPRQGCVCTGACIWQTCADL